MAPGFNERPDESSTSSPMDQRIPPSILKNATPTGPKCRPRAMTMTPLGGRQKHGHDRPQTARPLTCSTTPFVLAELTKSGTNPSLKVRVDNSDMAALERPMSSTPGKAIRRLPSLPALARPSHFDALLHSHPHSHSIPSSPFSTGTDPRSGPPPDTPRERRPLPNPPQLSLSDTSFPCTPTATKHVSPALTSPTDRPPVRKPLPTPVIDRLDFERRNVVSDSQANTTHLETPIPYPPICANSSDDGHKPLESPFPPTFYHEENNSVTKRSPEEVYFSLSPPPFPSSASSSTSTDSGSTRFKEDPNNEHLAPVDSAWMLSNRILIRQRTTVRLPPGAGQRTESKFSSQWILEKNGKRYMEVDYDSVLRALRTL